MYSVGIKFSDLHSISKKEIKKFFIRMNELMEEWFVTSKE